MLKSMHRYLHCPACKADLALDIFDKTVVGISAGILTCTACSTIYPIVDHIPRMVPSYLFDASSFFEAHSLSLDRMLRSWPDEVREISKVQVHTQENFGHEWDYYSRLGWTDETGTDASQVAETLHWFREKTLLTPDDTAGRLTLDAGCGNGRFSRAAFDADAIVISMDLTRAADVAFKNLFEYGRMAQVVQGDILHPPFRPATFDVVFTIGVIQHTGAPLQAAANLAGLVKPSGLFSIRTYQRGNDRMEENDAAIRKVTTTFTLNELHEFSDILFRLTSFLVRKGLYADVTRHICLFHKRYDIFDWYSAPVAAKLTYAELREVFAACGFTTLRDADDGSSPQDRAFSAISIVGHKR
ncbi:methyltransferase domain-containing protein [Desulfocurvibacter africanus]|uniref:Methyltransferase type 11 n=1 Tax=Desulfocurvibacter africanus subsp. africanus str. Walvis Bay TaxID=690850 RepID=F3YZF6_DESAF|nr:methyltransferase domain-containing protein [Desulfocurvibacter africanus]EGJ51985.1 Methyltransferase type 11 [Desulfocurvibacter africanus subsp. africanus str. Walvis Bay]